jgi:hypothetical protein
MFTIKKSHLFLLLGLIAPVNSFASEHYCIAVDGGFGHGGTTFIGSGFAVPGEGNCTPWSGFTKTASTVILTTTGTGCLSSDGKALTVSVSSADPLFSASLNRITSSCPGGIQKNLLRAKTPVPSVEAQNRKRPPAAC